MHTSRPSDLKGVAFIVASAACYGSLSILVTLAMRDGLPLAAILQWRFTLAAVVLAFILRRRIAIPARTALSLFALGVVGQATITHVSLSALAYIDPPSVAFLLFTYPIWLAALGALSGRVPLTTSRVLALGLGMAGLFAMLRPGSVEAEDWPGVGLALASAVIYALYLPAISRQQRGVQPFAAAFYIIAGAATSFTILSAVTGDTLLLAQSAWPMLGLIAIVPTVFAFTLLVSGVSILGAVRTSIVGTAEPFFTTMFAALFLDDQISVATLAGGTLIAAAVIVDALARRRAVAGS